jgi:uncharacterized cupin superfamily protein
MPKLPETPLVLDDSCCHPILGGGLGPAAYRVLGDLAGLTQFGCHIEELPPGSRSSYRHWHTCEDEAVYMLSGQVVLTEDSETFLHQGDFAAWPAGHLVGHCLENRSDHPARYLTIGTRRTTDTIHYPDGDVIAEKDGPARRWFHTDKTPRVAN